MSTLDQLLSAARALQDWALTQHPMFWAGLGCGLLIYLTIGCVLAARWTMKANRESPIDFSDADAGAVLAFVALVIAVFLGLILFWPLVLLFRYLVRLGQVLAKEIK